MSHEATSKTLMKRLMQSHRDDAYTDVLTREVLSFRRNGQLQGKPAFKVLAGV